MFEAPSAQPFGHASSSLSLPGQLKERFSLDTWGERCGLFA
ncbi:hypothetical protein ACVW1C_001269 [Bradyrhizobium sp. USDA 4011]